MKNTGLYIQKYRSIRPLDKTLDLIHNIYETYFRQIRQLDFRQLDHIKYI